MTHSAFISAIHPAAISHSSSAFTPSCRPRCSPSFPDLLVAPLSSRPIRAAASSSNGTPGPSGSSRTSALQPSTQQPSQPPPPLSVRDALDVWIDNILICYGRRPARDSCPIAEGDPSSIAGTVPFFITLHHFFETTGPIFKLSFGPKSFIVVQDPAIARSILREQSILYDKGILSEVLEEIMGKGLIPADYETWKVRRRAIVPAFHTKWLSFLTSIFAKCTLRLCSKLDRLQSSVVDMETMYNSLALDVVGISVFNYDFDSVNTESPVIKAVYRILKECEHRSTVFIPYWKIPGAPQLVPRLRAFYSDMTILHETLNDLIEAAKVSATSLDLPDLQARDYEKVTDPSLLRFLVELRGEQTTNKQLRDDLMTLLIAGHETVASVLTWATVELAKHPHLVERARQEIDRVIGDRVPTYEDVQKLVYVRLIIAETLRLYPAPPILLRRLLADTVLPKGSAASPTPLKRGADVFINVYSLHRSPELWAEPERFDPDRWLHPTSNPGVEGWAGYSPAAGLRSGSPLYPTELNADFAFLPFGGGARKCVGDVFAMLEATVALAMIMRRFDFEFADPSKDVPMTTGATIHTDGGLMMRMKNRPRTEPTLSTDSNTESSVPVTLPSL